MLFVENVETTYFDNRAFFAALASFFYSFVSPISVLLLSHSVQLTSPSPMVCLVFYYVSVIRLHIATTYGHRRNLCCSCLEVIAQC